MADVVWYVAAIIVLSLALAAILHPDLSTGVVGTCAIGSALLCGAAGLGDDVPPRWVIGTAVSMAVGGVWATARWIRGRSRP